MCAQETRSRRDSLQRRAKYLTSLIYRGTVETFEPSCESTGSAVHSKLPSSRGIHFFFGLVSQSKRPMRSVHYGTSSSAGLEASKADPSTNWIRADVWSSPRESGSHSSRAACNLLLFASREICAAGKLWLLHTDGELERTIDNVQ